MRRTPLHALTATCAAGAIALALGACGSGTKTVTVSSAPPVSQTTSRTKPPSTTTGTTSTSSETTPPSTTSTGATTRTAPEPAFTQHEASGEGAGAATALVREKGYTPNDTSQYHSSQALRVLVGTRTGSADGYQQQAFFFVNGHYIGTDAKEPSAGVKVLSQGDTEVTLGYSLYRPGEPLSSPGGGEARVTFQLNNGKLVNLQKIPPASSSTGLSRQ